MRESVIINEKSYVPAEITFGAACKLERMGLNIFEVGEMPLTMISGYIAITVGCSIDEAVKLMDEHIKKVGDYTEILETFTEAIEESDFFQGQGKKKKAKK